MYAPVSSSDNSSTLSRLAAMEARDQEGFESNVRCASLFAVFIAVIVIANYFLNQLEVSSKVALSTATYAGFSSRASTSMYFVPFQVFDNQLVAVVPALEKTLEFVPGSLVFTNDTCTRLQIGECANGGYVVATPQNSIITFSATGAAVYGHFWNVDFKAQVLPKWAGQNQQPTCPEIMTCNLGP
jgi:hypothetical protein